MTQSWLYVDDSGIVQGPFSRDQMADWYALGWFRKDLLVKRESKPAFKPLHTIRPLPEFTKLESIKSDQKAAADTESGQPRWYYIDADGNQQGPFDLSMMGSWYVAGYFTDNVMVRPEHEQGFSMLSEHKKLFTEAAESAGVAEDEEDDKPKHEFDVDDQLEALQSQNDKDVAMWYYIDDNTDVQGPFPADQMIIWAKLGYLHKKVKVKMDGDNYFKRIGDDFMATFSRKPEPPPEIPEPTPESAAEKEQEQEEDDSEYYWFYLDDSGKEQGPFSSKQMKVWYDKNLISPAVHIRSSKGESYCLFANRVPCPGWARHRRPEPIQWDLQAPIHALDSWFYIDTAGQEQGPFSTARMRSWLKQGLFPKDLRVRHCTTPEFSLIESIPELAAPSQETVDIQRAGFMSRGKRFRVSADQSYWESRGVPDDSSGRQMAHYFDVDAWQEQRNLEMAKQPKMKLKKKKK